MIGIVIPYFQRTPGLLNRALLSIAAQEGAHPFHVYVVDDSSPVPAENELTGLGEDFTRKVTILRQPNGGPGAARRGIWRSIAWRTIQPLSHSWIRTTPGPAIISTM